MATTALCALCPDADFWLACHTSVRIMRTLAMLRGG